MCMELRKAPVNSKNSYKKGESLYYGVKVKADINRFHENESLSAGQEGNGKTHR